jgi:hypothetical protein
MRFVFLSLVFLSFSLFFFLSVLSITLPSFCSRFSSSVCSVN